jgi:Xaa-Pro dipeptidase
MINDTRRQLLDAALAASGLDAILVFGNAWQSDYLRYVSDFGLLEGQGLAIARRGGEITLFLDHPLEAERARLEAPGVTVVLAPDLLRTVDEALDRAGNSRIGVAPASHLPHLLALRSGPRALPDHTSLLDRLLMHKSAPELDAMRRAARMADAGYAVFRDAARVGRKDYELIAEMEAFYRAHGVEDNFQIIGVGGPEVRGMAPPSGRVLRPGDMVTTELTPCVDGYYAQICRTLVMGEPNADQRAAFAMYLEAMEAGIATVRPGVTASDIARAENDVFRREGYGEYVTSEYTRVRGHGVGLFVDTKPHILEDVHTVIEEGMTIIVHPNTYHPVVGYLVLGDVLAVTKDGCEVLIHTPRELFSVPA